MNTGSTSSGARILPSRGNDRTVDELRVQVRDLVAQWRENGRFVPHSDSWVRSFDLDFSRDLASRGLIGMTWPRQYGGGEYSNVQRLAVTEELLRAGAPVAAHWIADRQIGPAILRHGSERLKTELLPGITRAEYLFCLGMSEPGSGSDLASVRTTAQPTDGGWLISGHKMWTSGAHRATHAYVLARTDQSRRKHEGLSEFVVDMVAEGVTVSPIVDISGQHHFNEVLFDKVFVPAHRIIGTPGDGWRQVTGQLAFERGGPERVLSSYPVLSAMLARPNDIRRIHLQERVGELVARLATLRRMCWSIANMLDSGATPIQEAAALKLLGNEFERDVIEASRPILADDSDPDGPYGQALLASPGFSIRGGAADVLLSIIAKNEVRA